MVVAAAALGCVQTTTARLWKCRAGWWWVCSGKRSATLGLGPEMIRVSRRWGFDVRWAALTRKSRNCHRARVAQGPRRLKVMGYCMPPRKVNCSDRRGSSVLRQDRQTASREAAALLRGDRAGGVGCRRQARTTNRFLPPQKCKHPNRLDTGIDGERREIGRLDIDGGEVPLPRRFRRIGTPQHSRSGPGTDGDCETIQLLL